MSVDILNSEWQFKGMLLVFYVIWFCILHLHHHTQV